MTSAESSSSVSLDSPKSSSLCIKVDEPSSNESVDALIFNISPNFTLTEISSSQSDQQETNPQHESRITSKTVESYGNIQMNTEKIPNDNSIEKSTYSLKSYWFRKYIIQMNASLEMNSQSNSDTAAETTNFCSFSENLRKNNNSDHYIYNNNINYSNKCLSPFMLNAPTTGRHNVSFVDVGVQTDDQMISHCDNEAHLKDNILIAPYNFDDFKASSDLDIFVDAVKCVYAEVKLELAEMIVNNLIGKYAEPLDTYNPVANLPRANTLCFNTTLNSNKFNNNKSLTFNDKSRSDHNSPTYFWPIFKLLLTQSEPQIFPDLYEPSLSEHELYDQSNRLAFDIRRTKSKLNILQSLQSRQSQENIITSATTISTSATSTITSNFENSPNCNQFHSSNDLVKTSQCSQRDSFIACLYDVRKNYKAYKSKTIPSNDLEHSKSPRSLTTQHRTPSHYGNQTAKYEKSLEQLLTNLHAKSSSNNANESTPSIYTDPKDCPLSLLSFVTNLNNLSSEEKEEGKQRKQQANYRRHHEAQPNRPPYKTSSHEDSLPLSSSSSSYTITDPKNEIMSSSMLNCPSKSNTTNNTTVTASNSNSFNNSTDLRSPAKIFSSFVAPSVRSPHPPTQPTVLHSLHSSLFASLSPITTCPCPQNGYKMQEQQQQKLISPMKLCYTRDNSWSVWVNNQPPAPDIRRSELDLADLSDGTRVLVIQHTYLRAGTLYLEKENSSLTNQISLSSDSLRDQIFRIHLDTENFNESTGSCTVHGNRLTPSSHANNSSRKSSSSSSSSSCLQPLTLISPSNSYGSCCGTSFTTNRRRQMNILLYGWQVLQQVVLEVFPASMHHVPPGTRVCTAWSEQLGVNLYPGTVVRTDSNEPVNDSVSVDFDDGDHRQVPLACLRILPKYFTNLYELVNATGEANVASCFMTSYYTRTSNYGKDNKGVSRKHRRRLYPSGSQSTSSLTLDTASTDCSSQMDSNFVSSPNSHNNDESNQTILSNRLSDGYISDDISFTALTTLGICRSFSWQILEKLKRRKQGCIYCHSIIRDIDGLIIKIGDCVKYSSGRHEIYLGEVREIRWEKINNSPIVVAAWYYLPHEAGIDGKLVEDIKGALFATEHKDENEAKCIEQRIKVAKTYSQFLQPHSNKPKQKNRMKVKRTITDESIELPSPNQIEKDIDKVNSEAIHNIEYSTFTERHSQQSNPPTTSVHDKTISPSKDDPDTFHYFIAGKYDPVKQQVLTWDAELAKMYNLEIRTNRE